MNREWEVKPSEGTKPSTNIQDLIYFEGMYNPVLRFAFTNVLDDEFVSYWNSQRYIVKAHETVKLPHHLAVKFTKEIVDRMMEKEKKGLMMAVPAMRKPYEDKVLALLPSEEKQELEIIRNEFIEQIRRDTERKEGIPDAASPDQSMSIDFEDLRPKNFDDPVKPKRAKK